MSVTLTDADRALLARPLNAILTVAPAPGRRPAPRPVWFEHRADGAIEMFTFLRAPRVARLRADPWAAVLVAAPAGEPDNWVALQGPAVLETDGAADTATRLAGRYTDLDEAGPAAVLESMLAEELVRIIVTPGRVARFTG